METLRFPPQGVAILLLATRRFSSEFFCGPKSFQMPECPEGTHIFIDVSFGGHGLNIFFAFYSCVGGSIWGRTLTIGQL